MSKKQLSTHLESNRVSKITPKTETKIRARTKLDSLEDIQREAKRTYRRFASKQISVAELRARTGALEVIRDGMRDAPALNTYTPPEIRILGLPRDCYFSAEQIAAINAGQSIVDIEQCVPFEMEDVNQTNKQLENSEQSNTVVELSKRDQRNAHFRLGFKDPGDDDADGSDGAA
jgi:hypothetical protein